MDVLLFALSMIATVCCIAEAISRFRRKHYHDAIAFLCLALFLFCAPAEQANRTMAAKCAATAMETEAAQ
jgi:hypothetical protein